MKTILKTILFAIIILCGCDGDKQEGLSGYPYEFFQDNDCLPRAIMVSKAFSREGVWSRVVLYYFEHPSDTGHAVCVYVYGGSLWTYDSLGSYSIDVPSSLGDALFIARQAEEKRQSKRKVRHAKFL